MTELKNTETAPVQRVCMRDHVRNVLLNRILDGSYTPGTHLKELVLAREFDVSQAPIREALRELEALGLVESERFRGTRVRSADVRDLREAYELRAVLEERAIQLAVPCSDDSIVILKEELRLMHLAADAHDSRLYAEHAVNFHRKIVELSGNRLFLRTWDSLHFEVRARIAAHRVGNTLAYYADKHTGILDAICAGDGPQAGRLLRTLIETLLQAIKVPTPGDEGSTA